jgi:glycosyltransferase involved in cell wall biosynthesis
MHIAIVAPTSIPSRRANTVQVMKMAQAFVKLKHGVHLAVPNNSNNNQSGAQSWQDIAHLYGLTRKFPIDWLPADPKLRKYDYAWHAVRWARRLESDLLYTRLPQAATLAALMGLETIFEMHDRPRGILGPILFKRYLKAKGARRLVLISKALASDLHQEFAASENPPFAVVIPDGVDLERYANLPGPTESRVKLIDIIKPVLDRFGYKFSVDRFTVGYTGHLYPGRGIHLILEMAKRLKYMNFLIVGGDPQDVIQVREIVRLNGLGNVTLTGFVPNAELPLYQASCDLLLMPYQRKVSASSGGDIARYLSPMKLFEYLACGRPICSSDLPVFREVLSDEDAVLLPPDDIDGWVAAIQNLRDNPLGRDELSTRSKEMAIRYSWERRAKLILEGSQSDFLT